MKSVKTPDVYAMYEKAVQDPPSHIDWFEQLFKEMRGRTATTFREDFCGTFKLSCEWIRRDSKRRAVCVDIDPTPLAYGKQKHWRKLTPGQRKRMTIIQADVTRVERPKADIVAACNFSFFVFKERKELVRYFRTALRSLTEDGLLVLELAGGPGMIETGREREAVYRGKQKWFTYVWDQKSFDPISNNGHYAIHFLFPDGRKVIDAFTYDWRLWSLPEVREALMEAGFSQTRVYWEPEHEGEGTGEYLWSETGDNAHAWVAYVVAGKYSENEKRK